MASIAALLTEVSTSGSALTTKESHIGAAKTKRKSASMRKSKTFSPQTKAKVPKLPQKSNKMLTSTWCATIARLQMEKLTPEMRTAMLQRAQRRRAATRVRRKCCKKMSYSRRAKSSWGSHTVQLRSAPMKTYRSLSSSSTMYRHTIQSDMAKEDDCEAEEEAASFRACVELPATATMEKLATDPAHGIGESEFNKILKDFAVEPDDDEGRATKFKLYEDYVETVASSRVDTLQFWSTCKKDFLGTGDGSAAATVDRSLKAIDKADNLGIDFEATCWFVHSMIKKANENEMMIQRVLSTIKTKVELLSQCGECPICLESLEDENASVLGCCHKVCKSCWNHWKKAKHGRAFCPICRHEDFVAEVAQIGAVDLSAPPVLSAAAPAAPTAAPAAPTAALTAAPTTSSTVTPTANTTTVAIITSTETTETTVAPTEASTTAM